MTLRFRYNFKWINRTMFLDFDPRKYLHFIEVIFFEIDVTWIKFWFSTISKVAFTTISFDVVRMMLISFRFFFLAYSRSIEICDQIKFKLDALFSIILVFFTRRVNYNSDRYVKEEELLWNLPNLTIPKMGANTAVTSVKIKTNRRTVLLHNNGIRCVLL